MSGRLLPIVQAGSRRGERALARLVGRGARVLDRRTERRAWRIVEAIRKGGDGALLRFVRELDGGSASRAADLHLAVPAADALRPELPEGFAEALERAIEAVGEFHARQCHPGFVLERDGVVLEERRTPLARVGLYVPGGRASYPSTVVMTVVPARLAGVGEIAVATPPVGFASHLPLQYTLARLGIDEVWGMGGAHAVAAFAYGTESIRRVDKIAGPGNAWVTAAKRRVAGDVGIDGVAGPTEVVIVAAGDADPGLIAADLLAQAEHDPRAAAILITDDRRLATAVGSELARQLPALATAGVARASLAAFGTAILVADLGAAVAVAEAIAPEHLQLAGPRAEELADRISAAGAVFVGSATPEVFGDYVAGPSHVLPTCGSARFASALGVEDFVRRSHAVRFTPEAARRWAGAAAALAVAEGLPAHAEAARRRLL